MSKKILAVFILLAFLFNIMGYYLLFELDKLLAKKEMSAAICSNRFPLSTLRVPAADRNRDFRRVDNREFIYKGKLYDIVREIRQGNDLVFLCLHDAREQALLEGLKKAQTHKLHLVLLDHLIKIACPEEPLLIGTTGETRLAYPRSAPILVPVALPVHSPPPKFF